MYKTNVKREIENAFYEGKYIFLFLFLIILLYNFL